jgi:peptidoglycan LD-endopeptidase LytH
MAFSGNEELQYGASPMRVSGSRAVTGADLVSSPAMTSRIHRALWVGLFGIGSACVTTTPRPVEGIVNATDHDYLRSRWLMVPVHGVRVRDVPDSYDARRDGNRTHNATDILAPRGTPVVSTDDGRVIHLARNTAGGITIYATDASERFIFYYAHLDRYHDGLAKGTKLAKGQVIGYVGTTGNAPANTPHLHFQAMRARDVRRWWEGDPLDVRPYLVEDGQRR